MAKKNFEKPLGSPEKYPSSPLKNTRKSCFLEAKQKEMKGESRALYNREQKAIKMSSLYR